jgi:hypothetical protein
MDPRRSIPLRDAIDREAIRDRLARITRAVDRRDFDLLRTCYWPDAAETHGAYDGPAEGFFEWLYERTRPWERTMFSLGQSTIDLKGDTAGVETYFTGYRKMPRADGGWFDQFVAGRYLDLMIRRDREWRIQHRTVVFEWWRDLPDSTEFANSPFGTAQRGARAPDDPMYRLFAGLL